MLVQRAALAIRQVIEADDARQAVMIALLLPQHEKPADAAGLVLTHRRFGHVAECVLAGLDRAVVLQASKTLASSALTWLYMALLGLRPSAMV